MKKKLIIGISGASGVCCAIELLKILDGTKVISPDGPLIHTDVHLVVSDAGYINLKHELSIRGPKSHILSELCVNQYNNKDVGASIASGSFQTIGMVVIPCSIKTLSGIAYSYNETLIARAADVCLKEGRKVVLCVRETPLHRGHLRRMLEAADNGATIMPICPSFYNKPQTVEDIAEHFAYRVLQQFGYKIPESLQWAGLNQTTKE